MADPAVPARQQIHHPWKWFLGLGVFLILLGAAGVSAASVMELTSVLVFGPMLLASSVIQLLIAFFLDNRKESILHLIAAGLEMILGFLILAHPLDNVVSLVVLIAVFLIVGGLFRLARSVTARSRGRNWIVVTGVVAVLLGVALFIGGPAAKIGFVGACIAVDFLCHGASWLAVAMAERKPVEFVAPGK